MQQTRRNLAGFQGYGYDKGRNIIWQAIWVLISKYVVEQIWCPNKLRVRILRGFGAIIGSGVIIRHGVQIHWPWKLNIGDNVWIGVNAWLLNLEPIRIESNVCISQAVLLCTGSHDASSKTFEFDNGPIIIEETCWIAARATILRGVTIGSNSLIGATALVVKDVPSGSKILAPAAECKKAGL